MLNARKKGRIEGDNYILDDFPMRVLYRCDHSQEILVMIDNYGIHYNDQLFEDRVELEKLFKGKDCDKCIQLAKDYGLIAKGSKSDFDSGKHFWLFRGVSLRKIVEYFIRVGWNYHGVENPPSMYDCTGRYFSHRIDVKRGRNGKILVTQWFGYDV